MPNRTYRRKIRNPSNICTRKYILSTPITSDIDLSILEIQQFFLDIMDMFSTQVEINLIIQDINSLRDKFINKARLYKLLDSIESAVSVISVKTSCDNSPNNTIYDIQLILVNVRQLVDSIPINDLSLDITEYIQDIFPTISDILQIISGTFDYSVIVHNISVVKSIYGADLSGISDVQDTILSIIENIRDGVSQGIIECRIMYLKELIGKL